MFSNKLATGRPDADDLAKIAEFGEKVAKKVADMTEIPAKIEVRGDDPVTAYYTPLGTDGKPAVFLKAKPKTDPEKCTKCGICATVCPMGSIPKDAGYLHRNLHQVPCLHQGMSGRRKVF